MGSSSRLRDFVAFLSGVRGDLANITAPPFFLAPQSVTEIGTCWTERPDIFVAAALEEDPRKRMLLVLKWWLASLRNLFYIGGDVDKSIKKPLNAFLGEIFMASWRDGDGCSSQLVTEQVSHHPPITAVHMYNNEHGIRGTGYSRVEMTFNGAINIKQTGHAQLHLDKYNEDYIIPLPDVKVKGFLSGILYPEISGTYHILSSNGLTSDIAFQGKGFWGSGLKNGFTAAIYETHSTPRADLYTVQGSWSDQFSFFATESGDKIDEWDTRAPTSALRIPDEAEQDPWESRRAWQHVLAALRNGDYANAVAEKSKLEEAQRAMRRRESAGQQEPFKPVFFAPQDGGDALFERLTKGMAWKLQAERTKGVWKYIGYQREIERPFHGDLSPLG